MALDVLVPQMGESVLEGTILEWKVKIGDSVKLNQPLVELMTDKVNIEIPAEAEGILTHQFAKEGDVVPVGTRIAVIDDGKGPAVTVEKPKKRRTESNPGGSASNRSSAEKEAGNCRHRRDRQRENVTESQNADSGILARSICYHAHRQRGAEPGRGHHRRPALRASRPGACAGPLRDQQAQAHQEASVVPDYSR